MPEPAPRQSIVLVTGCSSGIGREAVQHLRKAGALVIATARDETSIADLAVPGEVETLRLDVTLEADRAAAVAEVLRRHGRIDALVNNAGYGANLTVEDTTVEAMRALFEVNLFGVHDLTRRVLPGMRKQGRGRIVNVASIAGHIAVPVLGPYCASKFALRALTQAMDDELRPLGVRALLVEPGIIKTNFGARARSETAGAPERASGPYAKLYHRWEGRRDTGGGANPSVIARAIVRCCLSEHVRFHNFHPLSAKAGNLAKRWLPDAWMSTLMRAYFWGRV